MDIAHVSLDQDPKSVTEMPYDCLWVRHADGQTLSPAMQWVDWKLGGQLARALTQAKRTFIPSMRKLSIPFVAVEPETLGSVDAFLDTCGGMKFENVLIYAGHGARQFATQLAKAKGREFPRKVTLATEPGEAV